MAGKTSRGPPSVILCMDSPTGLHSSYDDISFERGISDNGCCSGGPSTSITSVWTTWTTYLGSLTKISENQKGSSTQMNREIETKTASIPSLHRFTKKNENQREERERKMMCFDARDPFNSVEWGELVSCGQGTGREEERNAAEKSKADEKQIRTERSGAPQIPLNLSMESSTVAFVNNFLATYNSPVGSFQETASSKIGESNSFKQGDLWKHFRENAGIDRQGAEKTGPNNVNDKKKLKERKKSLHSFLAKNRGLKIL